MPDQLLVSCMCWLCGAGHTYERSAIAKWLEDIPTACLLASALLELAAGERSTALRPRPARNCLTRPRVNRSSLPWPSNLLAACSQVLRPNHALRAQIIAYRDTGLAETEISPCSEALYGVACHLNLLERLHDFTWKARGVEPDGSVDSAEDDTMEFLDKGW